MKKRAKRQKRKDREREIKLFYLSQIVGFCSIAGSCEKIRFTNGVLGECFIYYDTLLMRLWSNIERRRYSCKP